MLITNKRIAAALMLVLLTSCSRPLLLNNGLFSYTVEPLTFNKEPTSVKESEKSGRGYVIHAQSPISGFISARVGRNGLGEIAREHGIETIYYADIERWSAAFGLWHMEVVHIYGK
jgi:hypothetical protein